MALLSPTVCKCFARLFAHKQPSPAAVSVEHRDAKSPDVLLASVEGGTPHSLTSAEPNGSGLPQLLPSNDECATLCPPVDPLLPPTEQAMPRVCEFPAPTCPAVETVTLRFVASETALSPHVDGRSKPADSDKSKRTLAEHLKRCRGEENEGDVLPFERAQWKDRCPSGGILLWTQMVVAAMDDDRPEWCMGRLFCGDGGIRFEEGSDSARWCGVASSFEVSFLSWMDVSAVEAVCNELLNSADFDLTDFRMDMCDLRISIQQKAELGLSSSLPASILRFQISFRLARLLQETWVKSSDSGLDPPTLFELDRSWSEPPGPPVSTIVLEDTQKEEIHLMGTRNAATSSTKYHLCSELPTPPLTRIVLEDAREKEVDATASQDVQASRNQDRSANDLPTMLDTTDSPISVITRENDDVTVPRDVPASRKENYSDREVSNPPFTPCTLANAHEMKTDHEYPPIILEDLYEEADGGVTDVRSMPISEVQSSVQNCTPSENSEGKRALRKLSWAKQSPSMVGEDDDSPPMITRQNAFRRSISARRAQLLRNPSPSSDTFVATPSFWAVAEAHPPAEKPPRGADFETRLPAPTTLESIREAIAAFDWPVNKYVAKQFKAKNISVSPWIPSIKQEGTWVRRLQCCISAPKKIPKPLKSVMTLPPQIRATFVFRLLNRSETILMVQEVCFHEIRFSEYLQFQDILIFEQHPAGGVRFQKFADVVWTSTSLPLALRSLKRFIQSKTKTLAVHSGHYLAELLAMDKDSVSFRDEAGSTPLPQGKRKLAM
eukprot:TRINITY_DN10872_c0_g2_i1.p1 TRINITY_DN10872_c0_g2~~TRINITY_DN10872_c0_g2_i1.p1  ORF type:complete len:799 (-),score=115.53 TRINITY_DN10872_c0_g2_i1:54-2390(-)